MKIAIFWYVTQCSMVETDSRLISASAFIIRTIIIEIRRLSGTLVNFYQTTQRKIPKTVILFDAAIRLIFR